MNIETEKSKVYLINFITYNGCRYISGFLFNIYNKNNTKMKHLKTPQELNEASENLNISDVSESFSNQDLSKEIDFFSDEREVMIDTVLMLFEEKLNEKDLQSLKKSLERTWDNGFRYGFSKNSH